LFVQPAIKKEEAPLADPLTIESEHTDDNHDFPKFDVDEIHVDEPYIQPTFSSFADMREAAEEYEEVMTVSTETPVEITVCVKPEPPDPLKEFWTRMQEQVRAGRLDEVFRVPGIGPPVSAERVTAVGLWLADCARRQEGLVGPRNIQHFLCPNLDDTLESVCRPSQCDLMDTLKCPPKAVAPVCCTDC
jgi:hypothetical protein